jgi:glycosyltransferase involved in cell wall biosynthesis
MKVLQIGSSLFEWAGIERWLLGLMVAQRERGLDVRLACADRTPLHRNATDIGISCQLVAARSQQDWRALPAFVRILRKERPEVVHTHFSPDYIVAAVAARMCRVPAVVMTRHMAFPWRGFKRRLYDRLYDRIIAVSEAVRSGLLSGGLSPDKVVTVYNGLAPKAPSRDPSCIRRELGIEPNSVVVGMCARVIREKGQRVLVEALSLVGSTQPDVVGLIVGGGDDLNEVKTLAQHLAVADRVFFTGNVEDPENYLGAMDIVAAPSTWPDAFPAAVQEAIMMGKPVIASNVGGIPELITDGETGILVPKDDPGALAEQIRRLAADPVLREQLAAAAKADATSRFSPARMAEQVEAVYRDALAGHEIR